MSTFYLFRSNIKSLEYYHEYKDLNTFKEKCHDFYLLQCIWFLENDIFDKCIVWRLSDVPIKDIEFNINGKILTQKWVTNFNDVFKYKRSNVSLFRGGFKEYDGVTKINPYFFGLKLYLGAGKRVTPKFNGLYDKILIEDEIDSSIYNSIPFYKTTNNNIFKYLNFDKQYDICLISNFTQVNYKGTDLFINKISSSNYLKTLKICHIGNNKEVGINLCKKLKVNNIEFLGYLNREEINNVLNKSKFGLVNSNKSDGCPRVSTEVLTSGTPLFIRDETRLLDYYKQHGVIEFNEKNIVDRIKSGFDKYNDLKNDLIKNLDIFSMEKICKKNLEFWL